MFCNIVMWLVLAYSADLTIASCLFECYPENLTIVHIYNKNYTCEKGKFCNIAQDPKTNCQACLDARQVCNSSFQCRNTTSGKDLILDLPSGKQNLTCYGDTFCTVAPEEQINCAPCTSKCPKISNFVRCINDTTVLINEALNWTVNCPNNTICNWNRVAPCFGCIAKSRR